MQETENEREAKPSKPPYLFLIPVAIGILGFIGYETVRMAGDTRLPASPYALATPAAALPDAHAGVARAVVPAYHAAQRLAMSEKEKHAKPVASPTPAASPSAPPSAAPEATPKATKSHKDVAAKSTRRAAPKEVTLAQAAVPSNAFGVREISRLNAPQQPAQTIAQPTAPVTEAPVVQTAADPTAKPEQVALVQSPSDRIVDAKMTYAARPDYPDIARDEGARGTSVVFVTVDPRGAIIHTSIASSSGNASLDRAALAAAGSSRYIAPKADGHSGAQTYRVVYDFAP